MAEAGGVHIGKKKTSDVCVGGGGVFPDNLVHSKRNLADTCESDTQDDHQTVLLNLLPTGKPL